MLLGMEGMLHSQEHAPGNALSQFPGAYSWEWWGCSIPRSVLLGMEERQQAAVFGGRAAAVALPTMHVPLDPEGHVWLVRGLLLF